jgi:hypothetical protein
MKNILIYFIISFICILSSVNAQQPTTIQQARTLIVELNTELRTAKQENNKLKTNLETVNGKLKSAETQISDLQLQANAIKDWGIEQQKQAFMWMAKYDKAVKRYHNLKTVAVVIASLFGITFGVWLMRFVPPVYGAYAFALPVACATLFGLYVWLFM